LVSTFVEKQGEDNPPLNRKYVKMESKISNYVVHIQDCYGSKVIHCDTVTEAWKAIETRALGGLYQVESPTNKPIEDFIPF
jgi:hypothetical protein